jgi:large subunit ribosomal protein L18
VDKKSKIKKVQMRLKRKKSIKSKLHCTSERPRLSVFRSLNHIYAQIIDDDSGKTLVSASSKAKEFKGSLKCGGNVEAAKKVGELLAKKALKNKITTVSFDRNGYLFHGRVKALADSAREVGLKF